MLDTISDKKSTIKQMKSGPNAIRLLYEKCVKYQPEERIKNNEIRYILNDELDLFICFDNFFKNRRIENNYFIINSIVFELISNHQINQSLLFLFNNKIRYFKLFFSYYGKKQITDPFFYLGSLYISGQGVKQDYSKAIEYYERSAQLNNSNALLNLGYLYSKGEIMKQDYSKAIEYYERSAQLNNSNALYKLGNLYLNGQGVKQDYSKAIGFFERSAQLDNTNALFVLGDLFSNDDEILINLEKSISYFSKSIKIQRGLKNEDNNILTYFIINNYRYISYNDLGLIYMLDFNEIQKAEENIKESAFAEYPFGQNNFGLYNEIYLKEIGNAEYLYQRSSKHNFSLAEYNLGHMIEKEKGKITEESAAYYIRASDHENEPLIYRNITRYDKRLEISKIFIICLTNLKLTEYYFSRNEYTESKKYFTKSFSKIINHIKNSKYKFKFIIKNKIRLQEQYSNDLFLYLKKFILNCPLFNLINQPNLELNEYSNIFEQKEETTFNENDEESKNEIFKEIQNLDENNKKYSKFDYDEKYSLLAKIDDTISKLNLQNENETKFIINEIKKDTLDLKPISKEKIFESPDELFEFVISNSNLNPNSVNELDSNSQIRTIFIEEIKDIIKIMNQILYTPPYPILFGRIFIAKPISKEKDLREDINEYFSEGFGF